MRRTVATLKASGGGMYGDVQQTAKLMMGERAIQVPLRMIIQAPETGKSAGIFQSSTPLLNFGTDGADPTHLLVLGDAIIRPHLVLGSNRFRGRGISGLYTGYDTWDEKAWLADDSVSVILPPLT